MAICYDTNGNQDTSQFPCSADGEPAQCCELGQYCASNGLCVNNGTNDGLTPYSIKGCSVQDWTDGGVDTCTNECVAGGGVGVSACGSGNFCCYGFGGCDCNNSTQVFSLGPVEIVATITGASTTTAATTTPTSTTTSDTSTTPTGDSSSPSSSSHLGLGLGVGLGVGIPLLIAAIFIPLFLRRRRANRAPVMASDKGGYYQPPPAQGQVEPDGSYFAAQQQPHLGGQTPYEHKIGPVSPGQAPPYTEHQAYEMAHEPVQQQPHELQ
ncbi:uncharacterized protein DSM5745_04179 [Aspergillus mulundensis]|uniref:Mid2 domain-containing protein n=1 Tax=Aspergillus mulundensis TaxID=1810919 RepID=A0A3D8SC40_9EURO|nr:hypothetical protein DSM5745_04179 [Aspergillus mulundensis]RDW83853.1 hypothetical protein DSM5745_04179 [Aspergillus mulundensis]